MRFPQGLRWWMLVLLFAATTINYMDRIVFSFLSDDIRKEFALDPQRYSYVNSAFQLAYTLGFTVVGRLVDVFGTRLAFAWAVGIWSLAAMLHVTAQSWTGLAVWRALLGLGESGNFPACLRAVTEWFPKTERALATGWFNAGSNVASMIGPFVFALLAYQFGWRACFLFTGALGFVWMIFWLAFYRPLQEHPRATAAERALVAPDLNQQRMSWGEAMTQRATWGFALAKLFSDPVWWFYLYWLPPYLYDVHKLTKSEVAWVLLIVYAVADVGSVAGGWLSGYLLRRGMPTAAARRTALFVCAACMPIAATAVFAPALWMTVALVSLATAAHQGWSANLYTVTSDLFPTNAIGTVVGIGGCIGGLGGVFISNLVPGYVVAHYGYVPVFAAMGVFHLMGLFLLNQLALKGSGMAWQQAVPSQRKEPLATK